MPILSSIQFSSVVIAGAGGMGLELYEYLLGEEKTTGIRVAGYIDDGREHLLAKTGARFIATIDEYKGEERQAVFVAIGSTLARKKVLKKLWDKNIQTPSYVHSTSILSSTASIGKGVVIAPFSTVNSLSVIKDGVLVNVYCSIGHEAKIGAFSILSPFVALNGNSAVGESCFLGTKSTIYPGITVSDGCVIDSHTGVRSSSEKNSIISSRGNYTVFPLKI